MRKNLVRFIGCLLFAGALSSTLLACGKGSHLGPNNGGWGDKSYPSNNTTKNNDNSQNGDRSSSSKENETSSKNGQSSGGNAGNSQTGSTVTTDNPYFEFRWNNSDNTASVRFKSGVEISEITIPSNYDNDGVNYRIISDDYEPGLGYKMDVTRIVFPEGFEEISLGFAHDMNLVSVKLPSTIKKIGNSILVGCNNFKTIEYNGTKAQWEAINKKVWNDRLPVDITIACKDGNITVPRDSSWDD